MARFPAVLPILCILGCHFTVPGSVVRAQEKPSGDPSVIDPESEFEVLFEGEFRTEGPSIAFDGTIYFVDLEQAAGGRLLRFDLDGTVHRILTNVGDPNGIMISPDQRTLYVGTNEFDVLGTRAILAFELAEDGRAEFRSVLASLEADTQQSFDGMAVDVDGNLYVAQFSQRAETGIAVYRPDGEQLAFIPTPGPATNVTFGVGSDARSLYITAGNGLYRIAVKRKGYHPSWLIPR
jgi:sugar lactone lactonase YvrE